MRSSSQSYITRLRPPAFPFKPVKTQALQILTDVRVCPKVTSVVAPPGYGKTILLTQLFRSAVKKNVRCFWVGLEDSDTTLTRLLGLIEDVLDVDEQSASLVSLGRDRDGATVERISRIVAKFSACTEQVALFIDNIDFCTEKGVEGLLNALVFSTPDSIGLTISSSGLMPFDTMRALLELRLRTIGPADLGFNHSNIRDLFNEAGITNLSDDTTSVILEQSGGWPAAVRLMQVIAETDLSMNSYAECFSRDGAHLANTLSRRLMSRFAPELVDFLCNVAEFRQFTAEMARHATGDDLSQQWISHLVDHNILIIPLDEKQTWFRFHALFRHFLIGYAKDRLTSEQRSAILVRGAEWLESYGHMVLAFDLSVRAYEKTTTSRLLEKLAWEVVRDRGDLPSFITWVEQALTIGTRLGVEANFWYVWALIFERRYELAKGALRDLNALIETSNAPQSLAHNLLAKAGLADIVLRLHLDSLEAIKAQAPAWLVSHGDAELFEISAVAGAMTLAHLADFQFSEARKAFRQSQSAVAGSASLYGRAWVAIIAASLELANGNPSNIAPPLAEIKERIRTEIGDTASIIAIINQVRARGLFDCGEIEQAEEIVAATLQRASSNGILDPIWMGIEVVLPSAIRGDGPVTLEVLRAIARDYPRRLAFLLELSVVRILANLGKTEEALKHASDLGIWSSSSTFICPDDVETAMERSAARAVGILLLTICGQFKKAEVLLDEEMQLAQEHGRRKFEVELYLMQAGLFLRGNQRRYVLRSFSRAITIAAERNLVQPFIEHGTVVAHIIMSSKIKELGITKLNGIALIEKLSRVLGCVSQTASVSDSSDEALGRPTPREIELLSMIDMGLDNTQIAETLSLSVRTVKWHLTNLYAKLDVKNRSSALAKARGLHLLG